MHGTAYPMPRTHRDETEMAAIIAALKPYADSPVERAVLITYWRGETKLSRVVFTQLMLHRWWREAPMETTHLTIHGPKGDQ